MTFLGLFWSCLGIRYGLRFIFTVLYFLGVKKKVTRENFTKILDFGREKKKVPVKKGEKPLKSTRENHFLPVKIFGNLHL